jgi:hypothetical protein
MVDWYNGLRTCFQAQVGDELRKEHPCINEQQGFEASKLPKPSGDLGYM